MTSYRWIGGSGTWQAGVHWDRDAPPSETNEALFTDGTGGTITGDGSANDAYFGNGGSWTYTGGALELSNGATKSIGPYALDVADQLTVTNATIDTRNGGAVGAPIGIGVGQ